VLARGHIATGLVLAVLWALPALAQTSPSAPPASEKKWGPSIDFEGKLGLGKIINNTITVSEVGGGTAHGVDVVGTSTNVLVSGNTITATGSGGASIVMAIQVNDASHPTVTITNNTLSASGGTTESAYVDLSRANIQSGSTGNVAKAGTCVVSAAGVGSTVGFTDGTTCGP